MTASSDLVELARRIADAMPADVVEEIGVTGSVSRGMADAVSDIEMLLVTREQLELDECYELARGAGLEGLDSWGPQGGPAQRVFGWLEGVPIELIWWSRRLTEESIASILAGQVTGSADAIAHAVPLRDSGALTGWQEQLAVIPPEVAASVIEDAALPYGGFAAAGLLTIAREGETLSRLEWTVAGIVNVLRIVYALNGLWPPTTKRVAVRAETLAVKPERFAERIEESLDSLLTLTELQLDTMKLAPDGPNVVRARKWLAEGAEILRR